MKAPGDVVLLEVEEIQPRILAAQQMGATEDEALLEVEETILDPGEDQGAEETTEEWIFIKGTAGDQANC